MARKPIFISDVNSKKLFKKGLVEFEWFAGFSVKQKQRSIESLHNSALATHKNLKILEISSKSLQQIGIELSAFNLMIETKNNKKFSVETAFQASKVFENGGPFLDLYEKTSRDAKKDKRLKESGSLIGFNYFKREFPLNPKTLFYNWLYINALSKQEELSQAIMEYNTFTDIEFNPDKSINCQAEAAAIYVSLVKNKVLEKALVSVDCFEEIVYGTQKKEIEEVEIESEQLKLL